MHLLTTENAPLKVKNDKVISMVSSEGYLKITTVGAFLLNVVNFQISVC